MKHTAFAAIALLSVALFLSACSGSSEPASAQAEVTVRPGSWGRGVVPSRLPMRLASTSDVAGQGRYVSARYGFSASVPADWRRARVRLVPKLLSPREILSLGTFAMPVGGGGNCGREPIVAIKRMQTGDALVSIQEYALSGAMRARRDTRSAPPPRLESVNKLSLRKQAHRRGEQIPAGQILWSTTLPFSDHGRWFDALIYIKGDPSSARLHEIQSILDRLRFRSGTYVGLPDG